MQLETGGQHEMDSLVPQYWQVLQQPRLPWQRGRLVLEQAFLAAVFLVENQVVRVEPGQPLQPLPHLSPVLGHLLTKDLGPVLAAVTIGIPS